MSTVAIHCSRPTDAVWAFYAGRDGSASEGPEATWVDEGLRLGTASYAIVDGGEALVVDTQTSLEHARMVRRSLEQEAGVSQITVLLTHWHLDHIAGTEVFGDCEIISGRLTDRLLARHSAGIESGTSDGPPPIRPLIRASRVLDGPLSLRIGRLDVELFGADIHSQDTYVAWLPQSRTLIAADAVEDPITYVGEPDRLEVHLAELDRLARLEPACILPAHGDPQVIATGGYGGELITATSTYIRTLLRARYDAALVRAPLREWLANPMDQGVVHYFAPYEEVHRANLDAVLNRPPS